MLSFGTDGRAGFWENNLHKYLTQVSNVLRLLASELKSHDKILRLAYFNFFM